MKIIQVCGFIEGAGITKYMNEVNIALSMAGHNVKIYEFPTKEDCKLTKKSNLNRENYLFDYNDETMKNDVCSADLVLVHQLMPKKTPKEFTDKFNNFLMNEVIKPVKVMFFNDHGNMTTGFSRMYGQYLSNKEWLLSFDKFAIHCDCNAYAKSIKRCIGEEEFSKRYVYMHHPHYFDPKIKENWLPLNNKYKRCTYIGRWHSIKHVEQVLEMFKKFRNDYEFEIRGVDRLINIIYLPDFFYEIDKSRKSIRGLDKDTIIGPSKVTWCPTTSWKLENGYDKDDTLIDVPHNNDRVWMFGNYQYKDGMEAMRKSVFGLEFYRLPEAELHGHNLEYAMHEIVEQGTIPIFDAFAMKSIKYFENGKPTNKTLYDMDFCLCLEPDMSNWEELKRKMDELSANEELYNEYRERALEVLSKHLDPVSTANEFINECFK